MEVTDPKLGLLHGPRDSFLSVIGDRFESDPPMLRESVRFLQAILSGNFQHQSDDRPPDAQIRIHNTGVCELDAASRLRHDLRVRSVAALREGYRDRRLLGNTLF